MYQPGGTPRTRHPDPRVGEDGTVQNDDARHDQLTTAPKATDADAAPRIDVDTSEPGVRKITIRDDAAVRPGNPDED